ncbi:MAG: undecaprenyldiphospho-muramoylpentapeptide beta-N-acetylglucosaminyltransferase [Clostridiales bacterium]
MNNRKSEQKSEQLPENRKLKAVITGGGTGGHIYPALAIAQGLKEVMGAEILYLGGKDTMENRLAPLAGFKFSPVDCRGLQGLSWQSIKALYHNLKGQKEAKIILQAFTPDIVIGTGGYVAAPVVLAAAALGIPSMIHEQNAFPGKANRLLSRKVDRVCLTFTAAGKHFPAKSKMTLTGLPVRQEILLAQREASLQKLGLRDDKPVFLITGGSQGARTINDAVVPAMEELLAAGLQVVHITGPKNYASVRQKLAKTGVFDYKGLILLPYLDKIESALAAADLVLARAGASFLSEMLCRGLPGILIPYPYAAGNHQEENARSLQEAGAALIIKDNCLNKESLLAHVLFLLKDRQKLTEMSAAARALAMPDALDNILKIAEELIKNK